MSFRDDLHRHFERIEALNPMPIGLVESVRAEAARNVGSQRPRNFHWAAVVAGVLAIAIVAGLLASGTLRRIITTPGSLGPAAPSQPAFRTEVLPPGNVLDASLYNDDSGWILLDRCSAGMCTYFVSTSQNKGPWTRPVQIGPAYPADDSRAPKHVHVTTLDGTTGFVYGLSEAWATRDGGQTWESLDLKSAVVSITGFGTAWMITEGISCDFLAPCAQVQVSHDGGRTWSPTSQLPVFSPANVVAFEKGGLLMSAYGAGDMLLTQDGGTTWGQIKGNCSADSVSNTIATSDGTQIWQACTGQQPNPAAGTLPWSSALFVSNTGGQTWTVKGSVPAGSFQALWSPVHDRVVVATNTSGVMLTTNAGSTWAQVHFAPQSYAMVSLSYLADGSAWTVDSFETIWATSNAGQSWLKFAVGFATPG